MTELILRVYCCRRDQSKSLVFVLVGELVESFPAEAVLAKQMCNQTFVPVFHNK